MELAKQNVVTTPNNNNVASPNNGQNVGVNRDNSLTFNLKDWFGKHATDKTIDNNGKKITTKVATFNITFVSKPDGGIYCKELPEKNLIEDQNIKITAEQVKPEEIPFKNYDLKIWEEREIEGFSVPSDKGGRGLASKVPDDASKNFETQFGDTRMVQIYYKAKHVMCLLDSGDEREIDFFMRLERRSSKKGQTNSSPFAISFLVSALKDGSQTVESSSKIHLALEKFDWAKYYFDGENGPCFTNDISIIDRFDDFYVLLGENGFHSLREVVPWPFRTGFLVNNKSGTIYANKIDKTKEEEVLDLLRKRTKSKIIKNKIASKEKKKTDKVSRKRRVVSDSEKGQGKLKKKNIDEDIQTKISKKKIILEDEISDFETSDSEEEKVVPVDV